MDYMMMQYLPGSIYSSSVRCRNCRQGRLMAGDGFLMNRCLNCGRYQHAIDPVPFDFSWVRSKVRRLWARVSNWASSEPNDLNFKAALSGGVQ
jgi:hypothetical protein